MQASVVKTANDRAAGLLRFHPQAARRADKFTSDVSIGRSPPCEILLVSDLVSRRHARLERRERAWQIRDLDSANGLFVNGKQVRSQLLADGDIIRVGAFLLRFVEGGDPSDVEPDDEPDDAGAPLLIGPSLGRLRAELRRAATDRRPVVLVGEAGVGKSAAARYLHHFRTGPFVEVHCTVSREQLDDLARQATGGTLFIRLADALATLTQRWTTRCIGRDTPVVISTRNPLAPELAGRLAGAVALAIPPLHLRPEDVPALVQHFVRERHRESRVTLEALEQLCSRVWPENVRQLEQAIAWALDLAPEGALIDLDHFDLEGQGAPRRPSLSMSRLVHALRCHRGQVELAAASLGISRSQLYRRAQRLGVQVADFRGQA